MVNYRIIASVVGVLLMVVGVLMLLALPFSLYYRAGDWLPILLSAGISVGTGALLRIPNRGRQRDQLYKRDGFLIVGFGWLGMALVGTLPYILSGSIPNLTDAFFESMSGLTTTGATVYNDIEIQSKGILLWRSLSQWIGGMGIIVLTVAIFPILGIGGFELFSAEAPGPTSDKIHPRTQETAKRLWLIYVALTGVIMITYWGMGMSFYDAVNHAFTTAATGGFSTKNASMAHFGAPIQYAATLFMLMAGINYVLLYFGTKGRFRKFIENAEFKYYVGIIGVVAVVATLVLTLRDGIAVEESFRMSILQVVSIVTTTGFVSADYTQWGFGLTSVIFLLLFCGAMAGSTSGGIKVIRHVAFFKSCMAEFNKLLHPRAISPIKIDKRIVPNDVMSRILVFLLLYLLLVAIGTVVLSGLGHDFPTALGATATSIGNVGPAIGDVGPVNNFASIHPAGKWVLSILMLFGRLEVFTFFVIFTPQFYQHN